MARMREAADCPTLVVRARRPQGVTKAGHALIPKEETMKKTLSTLHNAWALAHGVPPALDGLEGRDGEDGMATAEYAIGTLAAAAFAGLLLAIMRSGSLTGVLRGVIESALSVG